MASNRDQTGNPALNHRGFDTAGSDDAQAAGGFFGVTSAVKRSRLRTRTLVTLRWMVLVGELAALLLAALLGLDAPYVAAFTVVAVGAWVNVLTTVSSPGQRVLGDLEATIQLSWDVIQLSALIYLTGGVGNHFVLILIAPVTLAGATLPLRPLLAVGALAMIMVTVLAVFFVPIPGFSEMHAPGFDTHRLAATLAVMAGITLIAGYVHHAASESTRMALALDVTQTVLAREQRLSALGGLAAAAAHELGTPLATIAIVAKEMAREAPTPTVKEDAELLVAQAARCRDILRRLTDAPAAASDEVHDRLSLRQLVQEVIEPHADTREVRVEAIVTGPPGVKAPDVRRLAEITHAMTSFVENAVDFAKAEVLVTARFDAETISIDVRDDGPGFSADILARLGEPYVTSRPGAEGSRTGHIGMGLGFFISKTLLERTGAMVTFQNARPRGAVVSAKWPRDLIEVA